MDVRNIKPPSVTFSCLEDAYKARGLNYQDSVEYHKVVSTSGGFNSTPYGSKVEYGVIPEDPYRGGDPLVDDAVQFALAKHNKHAEHNKHYPPLRLVKVLKVNRKAIPPPLLIEIGKHVPVRQSFYITLLAKDEREGVGKLERSYRVNVVITDGHPSSLLQFSPTPSAEEEKWLMEPKEAIFSKTWEVIKNPKLGKVEKSF